MLLRFAGTGTTLSRQDNLLMYFSSNSFSYLKITISTSGFTGSWRITWTTYRVRILEDQRNKRKGRVTDFQSSSDSYTQSFVFFLFGFTLPHSSIVYFIVAQINYKLRKGKSYNLKNPFY